MLCWRSEREVTRLIWYPAGELQAAGLAVCAAAVLGGALPHCLPRGIRGQLRPLPTPRLPLIGFRALGVLETTIYEPVPTALVLILGSNNKHVAYRVSDTDFACTSINHRSNGLLLFQKYQTWTRHLLRYIH